jgi:F420 biosynthesis protein FbiB-like protein
MQNWLPMRRIVWIICKWLGGKKMAKVRSVIQNRRSIRRYHEVEVSPAVIHRIIEASSWAPSAHNAQPWRFVVIKNQMKLRLAKAMAIPYEQDLIQDGKNPVEIKTLIQLSINRFSTAPVLILACLTMTAMDVYPDEDRRTVEQILAIQSVAAGIQNLLLAAHEEDLGACWYCAPLFCQNVVKEILDLPADYYPQALITLGKPAETPDPPPRLPFEEIIMYIG